ncbi:tetratricopeptide repeat protein [Bradymonas sediminis]|uniref:tetratricopeptide repeat protein n=1 Tax=Bradymonas sediminis TaxID=1548548 RepID=UPI00105CA2E4|nr:tetratricopeptide repeat protein [Bradymonas sediminis]TDP77508.1 tetratricopeptide repeat protein [Bradymonas sediminis]
MSHSSGDGTNQPASDRSRTSQPGQGSPAQLRDQLPSVHREDETLSRVTRTLKRGIAPGGWDDFAEADRGLLENLGGLDQPFALDINAEFRRTVEFEDAFPRFRPQDYDREQTPRDAVDPFDLVDLRIEPDPDAPAENGRPTRILVGLGAHGGRVPVAAPWAQFLEELREETSVEGDLQLRSSYVFLVANLLRFYGADAPEAAAIADALHGAATQLPGGLRASLVDLVVQYWGDGGLDFIEMVEQLEQRDNRHDPKSAGHRRASIALERLLGGALEEDVADRMRAWLYAPETLAGLGFRGIRAHQQGARVIAAQIWEQAATYLREEPRQVVADTAVYFMRDAPGFFERVYRQPNLASRSRAQLLMMQRHAAMVGDPRGEAMALYELVMGDIEVGKREQRSSAGTHESSGQSAWQARLKALAAARLFRLSTLLYRFKQAREAAAGPLAGLSAYRVLHDAASLAPDNRLYLRRLVRRSRQRGDLKTCAKSLRTLARDYHNHQLAALAATELARTIFLSANPLPPEKLSLVERYLGEALASDPACEPALLALRRLHRRDDGERADDARGADEAELFARGDWSALADRLEQRLGEVEEPQEWSALAFRIAQLHAWHLSPISDSRLRAEFLEQVLIGAPEHVPTLVELLDVRLARQEYPAAHDLLETLADLAHDLDERGAWLVERAELLEYHLGDPAQAARVFRDALRHAPANTDAFLGLLRCDGFLSDAEMEQGVLVEIVARLDAGVSVHESDAMAVELMLRAEVSERAREILEQRFSGLPLWQFIKLCASVSDDSLNHDALRVLKRMWMLPRAVELLDVFERFFVDPDTLREAPTREAVKAQLGRIDIAPAHEGRMLWAMQGARGLADPEIFGLIAALNARRSRDFIARESHLLWMAMSFLWRGEQASALKICEHILARFPDFMPALKLAKIIGPSLGRWAEVARWCELEARRTRVERVGFESRLMASEVQQNYLGDFDAACLQFRTLLQQDPAHPEAFEKLKDLLLQRGDIPEVLELFEQRLSLFIPDQERISLLNEMGKIALYRANNTRLAKGYFARSLDLDRQQLRVLRIIGELHHEVGDYDEAIRAYRDAVALSEHTILIERLLLGIAALHELAGQPAQAIGAYQEALDIDPDRVGILLDIARLQMECGANEDALGALERLIAHEEEEDVPPETSVLREALSRRAQCLVRLKRPRAEVMSVYQALLQAYPESSEDVDAFAEYMRAGGFEDEVEPFFDKLAVHAFLNMSGRPFAPHFDIARRLGHVDRAFNLAAVAGVLGYTNDVMQRYHEVESKQRRWPHTPLPVDIVAELTPATLTPAFVGILRHSEAALAVACAATGALPEAPAESTRLDRRDPALPDALKKATAWPGLFGLELREVREYSGVSDAASDATRRALAGGSLLVEDDGARLYLDARWREAKDPTQLLVHLGQQLAAWSLGIGKWQYLDLRTRFLAVSRVVDSYVPGWGSGAVGAETIDLDAVQQWAKEAATPELAVHALDIAARLSVQGVEPEFRLVELTLERAACVLLDDPARFLPHTKYLGSEHGMLQQPWSFLFSDIAAHIRHRVGVAREREVGVAGAADDG